MSLLDQSTRLLKAAKVTASVSALIASTLFSVNTSAGEGGFVGLQLGAAASLDIDNTDASAKLYVGSNITNNLALEFGYLSMGTSSFDDPKAVIPTDETEAIYFTDAKHGSVTRGQVRDGADDTSTTDVDESTLPKQAASTFKGLSELSPHGVIINLRYNFNIMDSVDFFVKGGAYAWVAKYREMTLSVDNKNVHTKTYKDYQESAVQVITGGGFMWTPIDSMKVRAEMETVAIDTALLKRTRYEVISLGVQYEF